MPSLYPTAIESLCFLALVFTMIIAWRNSSLNPQKMRLYVLLAIAVEAELLLESIDLCFPNTDSLTMRVLRILVNFIGFTLLPLVTFIFSMLRNSYFFHHWKPFSSLAFANIIVLLFNAFYPFIYGIDANCVYYRGPQYWIEGTIAGVYFCLMLASDLVTLFRKKSDTEDIILISICYLLPILGSLFQVMNQGWYAIWPSVSLTTILYFLYIRVQDGKRDQITGLLNRMTFSKRISQLNKKGRLSAVTVGVFDINSFKSLNDSYGHIYGDKKLAEVASVLCAALGKDGLIFRTGGDEFCFLGEKISPETIQRAQTQIAACGPALGADKDHPLIIAQGYASGTDDDKDTYGIYKRADRAMYEDKQVSKEHTA